MTNSISTSESANGSTLTIEDFRATADAIVEQLNRVIVGQQDVMRLMLIGVIAGGHVLLEGVPGLGKTMLIRTLGDALNLTFSRIQFTPDLMPADITGTTIMEEDEGGRRGFRFQQGPVFANLVLADEINRATPKTQSALLEAMQEKTVTSGGQSHRLKLPFFVLATQNPLDMEGTYPLPEAQLDRFLFKINVGFPTASELVEILGRTTGADVAHAEAVADAERIVAMGDLARRVPIASHVAGYVARLIIASHPEQDSATDLVQRFVRYGASPRGAQALILGSKINALLAGRYNVAFDDVRAVAPSALRHRLLLNFEGQAEGISTDDVISELLDRLPELAS
ncbi:MAG: AAA family ATPase [Aggregatilineales bacterium]